MRRLVRGRDCWEPDILQLALRGNLQSIERHVGCSQVLANINKAAMSVHEETISRCLLFYCYFLSGSVVNTGGRLTDFENPCDT